MSEKTMIITVSGDSITFVAKKIGESSTVFYINANMGSGYIQLDQDDINAIQNFFQDNK